MLDLDFEEFLEALLITDLLSSILGGPLVIADGFLVDFECIGGLLYYCYAIYESSYYNFCPNVNSSSSFYL